MAEQIHADRNRFAEQFRKRAVESAAIITAAASLIFAILSLVLAAVAFAVSIISMRENAELQEQHNITQIYVRDLKAYMIQQGFKPPEPEEDEK